MNSYSYVQWKIAMARMQDANLAAIEIAEQGQPIRPEARKIAERQLDYYFELCSRNPARVTTVVRASVHRDPSFLGVLGF